MARRKITNVSGDDLVVPWLDGRVVTAGDTVSVDEDDLAAYLCQPGIWQAGDHEAQAAYDEAVAAAAEQLQAEVSALLEANPEPWAPLPEPLGAYASITAPPAEDPAEPSATSQPGAQVDSGTGSEVAAPPLESQPAPAATPAAEPTTTPEPATDPEPAVEPSSEQRLPPRLQQLLDRTSAPAASVLTGSLPAQPRL